MKNVNLDKLFIFVRVINYMKSHRAFSSGCYGQVRLYIDFKSVDVRYNTINAFSILILFNFLNLY